VGTVSCYLIVTHKTAFSAELRDKVGELVARDASAEFGILVPWDAESVDDAGWRAERAQALLKETVNANVVRICVGSSDPLEDIGDELKAHPDYNTLVICTLPPGVSRWLRMDLVHQAERKFGLPIIHVVAHSPVA
jgi:hypothetical protein